MYYSSVSNEKIKTLKKLQKKKYRDTLFLVEGEHLVKEAYKSGNLKELLLCDRELKLDVTTNQISKEVEKCLSSLDTPSGYIGVCTKKDNVVTGNKIMFLENIQDPGNLGTIIRSCVAFNIDTLILSSDCVDLYNPKVLRATQGMNFLLNIVISDIDILNKLKSEGYTLIGTDLSGNSIKSIAKENKFVIIMGNEGTGISSSVLNLVDSCVSIKMNEACESLNVAVAASIILYELGGV